MIILNQAIYLVPRQHQSNLSEDKNLHIIGPGNIEFASGRFLAKDSESFHELSTDIQKQSIAKMIKDFVQPCDNDLYRLKEEIKQAFQNDY